MWIRPVSAKYFPKALTQKGPALSIVLHNFIIRLALAPLHIKLTSLALVIPLFHRPSIITKIYHTVSTTKDYIEIRTDINLKAKFIA